MAGPVGIERLKCWFVLVPALVVPALGALGYFLLIRDAALARIVYAATKLFILLWPAAAWFLILRQPSPALLEPRRHWRALPLAAVTGLVIGLAIVAVTQISLGELICSNAPVIRSKAETFGVLQHYWLTAVPFSIGHSLLEEYYWRWFVYGRLRGLVSPMASHIVAGFAFAGHHVVITGVYFGPGWGVLMGLATGIGGIIWSVLYQEQGTLAGAWLSHALADVSLAWVGYRLLF